MTNSWFKRFPSENLLTRNDIQSYEEHTGNEILSLASGVLTVSKNICEFAIRVVRLMSRLMRRILLHNIEKTRFRNS